MRKTILLTCIISMMGSICCAEEGSPHQHRRYFTWKEGSTETENTKPNKPVYTLCAKDGSIQVLPPEGCDQNRLNEVFKRIPWDPSFSHEGYTSGQINLFMKIFGNCDENAFEVGLYRLQFMPPKYANIFLNMMRSKIKFCRYSGIFAELTSNCGKELKAVYHLPQALQERKVKKRVDSSVL